jgi:hypothetical protein
MGGCAFIPVNRAYFPLHRHIRVLLLVVVVVMVVLWLVWLVLLLLLLQLQLQLLHLCRWWRDERIHHAVIVTTRRVPRHRHSNNCRHHMSGGAFVAGDRRAISRRAGNKDITAGNMAPGTHRDLPEVSNDVALRCTLAPGKRSDTQGSS